MSENVERFTGADGRPKVLAHGINASVDELTRQLARKGGHALTVGWASPLYRDRDTPPPGLPVVWYVEVEWRDGRPATRGESTPTADYRRGVLEALADAYRQAGGTVNIVEAVPDTPEGLT